MGGRINTIMQTCFFAISGVLPRDEAIAAASRRRSRRPTASAARRSCDATSRRSTHTLAAPARGRRCPRRGDRARAAGRRSCPPDAPDFVQRVTARDDGRQGRPAAGERVPGRRHLADRHRAVGEAQHRRRDPGLGRRSSASSATSARWSARTRPSAPRSTTPDALAGAPADASSPTAFKGSEFKGSKYTIQVAPEDCTGCNLCVEVCPAKDKANPRHKAINMAPQPPLREAERENYEFFLDLPEPDRDAACKLDVKGSQFLQPLFEYSGACAGCGETPYLKLLTQLFGDRLLIANATGCSSIYGGNLPTTPYTRNRDGRGPGLVATRCSRTTPSSASACGWRVDQHDGAGARAARAAGRRDRRRRWPTALLEADQPTRRASRRSASGSRRCGETLAAIDAPEARAARRCSPTTWCRRACGSSAATAGPTTSASAASTTCCRMRPRRQRPGARHRGLLEHRRPGVEGDAARRRRPSSPPPARRRGKKDLGLMAMTLRPRLRRARRLRRQGRADRAGLPRGRDAIPGRRSIIAYSHCIAHGYDMAHGAEQQKLAVDSRLLAALPLRPAARRARASRRCSSTPAPPQGRARASTCATRRASAWSSSSDPERFRRLLAQAAARRRAARRGLRAARAASLLPDAGASRAGAPRRARRSDAWTSPRPTSASTLPHPLMPGASPLVDDLDTVRRLEDAGAAAIVMHSLFEEQIAREQLRDVHAHRARTASRFAEALQLLPDAATTFALGPDEYLEQLRRVKAAVAHAGDRVAQRHDRGRLARLRAADRAGRRRRPRAEPLLRRRRPDESGRRRRGPHASSWCATVKASVTHPGRGQALAVLHVASRTSRAGSTRRAPTALVLFNRFYQPDIDVEELEVVPRAAPVRAPPSCCCGCAGSRPVRAACARSLAVTGGVHTALDVVKAVMAGAARRADGLRAAAPRARAPARRARRARRAWMEEHEYESLAQMQGSMSLARVPGSRAPTSARNYMLVLQGG